MWPWGRIRSERKFVGGGYKLNDVDGCYKLNFFILFLWPLSVRVGEFVCVSITQCVRHWLLFVYYSNVIMGRRICAGTLLRGA